MPATYTPIRYPGGKSKIYPLVKSMIDQNGLGGKTYCEVFAGGAGLAMKLLLKNDVPKVVINDYDRAVFCMWDAIVHHSEELCAFIDKAQLTVAEWKRYREVYRHQDDVDDLELGKAAFYLNRTNVSGILDGGLIGGLKQTGNYKMDARFSRGGLKGKIRDIAARKNDIELFQLDAEAFIEEVLSERTDIFCYCDPPYVEKGPGLYHSSFDDEKHRSLAKTVKRCSFPWFATYDAEDLIDELYEGYIKDTIVLGYSAHSAGKGKERLIMSSDMSYASPNVA